MEKKFYISTAIAYASSKPHIGNTYEIVLADVIARYKRLCGFDVYFQTGTDEHGEKIEELASKAGMSCQDFVDDKAKELKRIWNIMNTSYDKFVRTTDIEHVKRVQDIFLKFYEQGDIYLGEYKGMYCTPCESFWTSSQLVDGRCPDCGREVKEASEEAYFFKMSKYSKWLLSYIESHPDFIVPESRKNEIVNNFIKPGLQDLCVSRTSFTWGIPVTFNDKHVIYVWIDALSNYITFLGYNANGESSKDFLKYWPCDVHIIGKDILRFHTIYWPIMLHALGLELPHTIFGHPWLLFGNDKMSKSKGNIAYADDLVNKYGVDAVRFYFIYGMPYASDGTYTEDIFVESFNSNLANILGNLVSRTLGMINRYLDGVVQDNRCRDEEDSEFVNFILNIHQFVDEYMNEYKVSSAMDKIMEIFRRCNKYIDETMPWVLAKDETKFKRLECVLYNLSSAIRIGTIYLQAFLPDTANEIFNEFNVMATAIDGVDNFYLQSIYEVTKEIKILFKRIDT